MRPKNPKRSLQDPCIDFAAEMDYHDLQFLKAVDKQRREKRFLQTCDYLRIVKNLGWTPPPGEQLAEGSFQHENQILHRYTMTLPEAAAMLGVHRTQIVRLIKTEKISAIRVRNRWRIDPQSL